MEHLEGGGVRPKLPHFSTPTRGRLGWEGAAFPPPQRKHQGEKRILAGILLADKMNGKKHVETGKKILMDEAACLSKLAESLDGPFERAVDALMLPKGGRIILMGMGKSGHVARKIATTLASTGSPSFFVHPAEAAHGDIGMINGGDAVLVVSHSGESREIIEILPAIKRRGAAIVAITGNPLSTLARHADHALDTMVREEAGEFGLVPTSSAVASMALGDAIATSLLLAKNFTRDDYALTHPAGSLGKRLLVTVRDIMRKGDELPKVNASRPLREAIIVISEKGLGLCVAVNENDVIRGVFTDGDLRRLFQKNEEMGDALIGDVMTRDPKTITQDKLAVEALESMRKKGVDSLVVASTDSRLQGVITMRDLLAAGIF